jgi:hypothetical protein
LKNNKKERGQEKVITSLEAQVDKLKKEKKVWLETRKQLENDIKAKVSLTGQLLETQDQLKDKVKNLKTDLSTLKKKSTTKTNKKVSGSSREGLQQARPTLPSPVLPGSSSQPAAQDDPDKQILQNLLQATAVLQQKSKSTVLHIYVLTFFLLSVLSYRNNQKFHGFVALL